MYPAEAFVDEQWTTTVPFGRMRVVCDELIPDATDPGMFEKDAV